MRLNVKTLPDRFVGEMIGVSYDLENRIFLTPDNLLEVQGDPSRLDSGLPVFQDGLILYAGTDPQELVQQNEEPIPFHQSSYTWQTLQVDGSPPPDPSLADTDIPAIDAPKYKLVNAASGGFQSASYEIFYSGIDSAGRYTLLSPAFAIPSSAILDSQSISMNMPSLPAQWSGLAWWMDKNLSNPYLQVSIDLQRTRPDTFDLEGPYRGQKVAPTVNQTYLGRCEVTKALYQTRSYPLLPGGYKFYSVYETANGESLPAATATLYNVVTTRANSSLTISAPSARTGAVGWRVYALQADGRYYVVYPANSNPDRPLGWTEKVNVYSFDPTTWPVDATGAFLDCGVSLSDFDPSRAVDTSGIPDPQDAPSPNVPDSLHNSYGVYGGSGLHDTGTVNYYVAFTATIGGIEGPRSKAVRIPNVPAGSGIRLFPPKNVQRLRNAEQTETGTDGLPLDITVSNATISGAVVTSQPGFTQVALTGVASTAATPAITTTPVDLKDSAGNMLTWTLQGELQVSSYTGTTPGTTGQVRVQLEQFNVTQDQYLTTPVAAIAGATVDLTLETGNNTIDSTGSERFTRTILPSDNFWNPAALSARLTAYTPQGTVRTLVWTVVDLGMHPQEHTPEKFIEGDPETGEPDDADPPPHQHHHEGPHHHHHKHRRKKHPRRGRALPGPDRPTSPGITLNTWTAESGEDRSSLVATGSPSVSTTAALTGTNGFLFQDTNVSSFTPSYYTATLSAQRTWLGVRPRIKVQTLPSSGNVEVLRILDQNGGTMLSYLLSSTGTFTVQAISEIGTVEWTRDIAHTNGGNAIAALDIIAPELVATGGNSDDGLVRAWYSNSRNFSVYSLAASNESDKQDLDWTERFPQSYVFGIISMSVASATCTLYFDDVIVTENGLTHIRDRAGDGKVIYQGTLYIPDHAGQPVRHNVLPRSTRIAAKPSTTYVYGFYSRWSALKGNQRPFHISATRLDGGSVDYGTPYGGGPISGSHGWAEYAMAFTTPEDCYELTIAGRDVHVGKIKYQELSLTELSRPPVPFISNSVTDIFTTQDPHEMNNGDIVKVVNQGGALPSGLDIHTNYYIISSTTFTYQLALIPGGSAVNISAPGTGINTLLRDLPKRTSRRNTTGSFRSTFDTDTPMRGTYAPHIPRDWTRAGVDAVESPDSTDVAVSFRSSNATFNYSRPQTDISLVPPNKYLEITATLTGDGVFSPVISGISPYVEQTLRVATLLREDGSEFAGGVIVTDAQTPATLPNVEVRTKLDKRIERHLIAAPLGSFQAFKLQMFTDETAREIMETWLLPTSLFRIEYRGLAVTIKPREQIQIKQQPATQFKGTDPITGKDYYYVYATADVSGAEIVGEASL